YMVLNDVEYAQNTFYELVDYGEQHNDTSAMINGLYSIGQLYSDEGEYESAISHFLRLRELTVGKYNRLSNRLLMDLELTQAYFLTGQYEEALEIVEQALGQLDEKDNYFLEPEFLIYKAKIALAQNDVPLAAHIDDKIMARVAKTEDPIALRQSQLFHGQVLRTQQKYSEALGLYNKLLMEVDSFDNAIKSEVLQEMQGIYSEKGNHQKAYEYLQLKVELEQQVNKKETEQKVAYYKIKHESEQKEKKNQALALELLKEKNEIRMLYGTIAVTLLSFVLMFGAFYQKRKYNSKLRHEVKRQTKKLTNANTQLTKYNEELDQFNRILSHDLKEPLRSVVSFSQLAKKQAHNPAKLYDYLQIVEESGQQLHKIIEDVSAFNSIDHQLLEEPQLIELEPMISQLKKVIQSKMDGQEFSIQTRELPVAMYSWYNTVHTVFTHLIWNAIQFNRSATASITISYFEKGGFHYFEFEDNGIGIRKEYQDQIFDMFIRLHNRSVHRGSGLGLSICKKMLQKVSGSIQLLRSAEQKGSVFQIKIPVIRVFENQQSTVI
ncbi:MAG: ATP-binding protein, partial [Bacteroidota bacterium]